MLINRRNFVRGAAATAIAASLPAGAFTHGAPVRTPYNGGPRSYGVFQTPGQGTGAADLSFNNFSWDQDWKNQIDAAKGLGANHFVYFGDPRPVVNNGMSIPTYIGLRRQILDYLEAQRMFSTCIESYSLGTYWASTGITTSAMNPILAAVAVMLNDYNYADTMVLNDEAWGASDYTGPTDPILLSLQSQYGVTRPLLRSTIGLAATTNPGSQGAIDANNAFEYSGQAAINEDAVASINDFLAFNPQKANVLSDTNALHTAYAGKKIYMTGGVAATSDAAAAAITTALMALVGSNNIVNFSFFIEQDFGGNAYGLFDIGLARRTVRTNAFIAGIH